MLDELGYNGPTVVDLIQKHFTVQEKPFKSFLNQNYSNKILSAPSKKHDMIGRDKSITGQGKWIATW